MGFPKSQPQINWMHAFRTRCREKYVHLLAPDTSAIDPRLQRRVNRRIRGRRDSECPSLANHTTIETFQFQTPSVRHVEIHRAERRINDSGREFFLHVPERAFNRILGEDDPAPAARGSTTSFISERSAGARLGSTEPSFAERMNGEAGNRWAVASAKVSFKSLIESYHVY